MPEFLDEEPVRKLDTLVRLPELCAFVAVKVLSHLNAVVRTEQLSVERAGSTRRNERDGFIRTHDRRERVAVAPQSELEGIESVVHRAAALSANNTLHFPKRRTVLDQSDRIAVDRHHRVLDFPDVHEVEPVWHLLAERIDAERARGGVDRIVKHVVAPPGAVLATKDQHEVRIPVCLVGQDGRVRLRVVVVIPHDVEPIARPAAVSPLEGENPAQPEVAVLHLDDATVLFLEVSRAIVDRNDAVRVRLRELPGLRHREEVFSHEEVDRPDDVCRAQLVVPACLRHEGGNRITPVTDKVVDESAYLLHGARRIGHLGCPLVLGLSAFLHEHDSGHENQRADQDCDQTAQTNKALFQGVSMLGLIVLSM